MKCLQDRNQSAHRCGIVLFLLYATVIKILRMALETDIEMLFMLFINGLMVRPASPMHHRWGIQSSICKSIDVMAFPTGALTKGVDGEQIAYTGSTIRTLNDDKDATCYIGNPKTKWLFVVYYLMSWIMTNTTHLGPLLLTWFNWDFGMDNWSHPMVSVGCIHTCNLTAVDAMPLRGHHFPFILRIYTLIQVLIRTLISI